jgi:MFS transporter, DHA1 family, multidrug resistance protein
MTASNRVAGPREFIAICAFLMATIALAIDMMLPAMEAIAHDFQFTESWQKPWIILGIFAGLMAGQLFFGPLSDAIGRKPAIQLGLIGFILGTLVCALAESFTIFVLGRLIQGFGAASARIVTQAMIRDRFSGTEMARAMSFVMTIFILIPIFAPMLGQAVLWIGDWRLMFVVLALFAGCMMLWVGIRQPETHVIRQPFSFRYIGEAIAVVLQTNKSMRFTIAAGISFGGLISYLSAVQQVFQTVYDAGDWFAVLFGATAIAIAASSLINAKIVRHFGMERICRTAFSYQVIWSTLFLIPTLVGWQPDLVAWLIYIVPVLFLMGLTFANLQSVAMEPMGQIAGVAATVIGSMMTAISLIIGILFSLVFDEQVVWLIATFGLTGLIARILIIDSADHLTVMVDQPK